MYTLLELFPIFVVLKRGFLEVVRFPYPKKQFLVVLRSFFSKYKFFPGRGEGLVSVCTFEDGYFNKKMSCLAGLEKVYLIFLKSTDFGHFWLARSTFKVDFLNVKTKFC